MAIEMLLRQVAFGQEHTHSVCLKPACSAKDCRLTESKGGTQQSWSKLSVSVQRFLVVTSNSLRSGQCVVVYDAL